MWFVYSRICQSDTNIWFVHSNVFLPLSKISAIFILCCSPSLPHLPSCLLHFHFLASPCIAIFHPALGASCTLYSLLSLSLFLSLSLSLSTSISHSILLVRSASWWFVASNVDNPPFLTPSFLFNSSSSLWPCAPNVDTHRLLFSFVSASPYNPRATC